MIQQGLGLAAVGRARKALLGALVTSLVAVPVALAAAPRHAEPGQRIDLKVLLVADSTSDSWTDNLKREGIPFDLIVTSQGTRAVTDDKLADYAGNRAKYQAVIVDTPISADDDAALAKLESTFGVRRLSPYVYPSLAHGMDVPFQSGPQDGNTATLTAAGRELFPYLKGDVPIADEDKDVDEAWGYQAKPAAGEDFRTLLEGPGGSAYVGVHTRADGREEMVMTVASNATQSHAQLLRHGMINWVTRGVYLGVQRNYLELHVDDLFLGDDSWDPATNTTNYDPSAAIRLTAGDLDQAAAWSKATGLRLDMAFNGDGAEQYKADNGGSDPLLSAAQRLGSSFGWINHTWDHTNLDCSTRPFIADQALRNAAWAKTTLATAANPQELITGEHSGLANTRPGNPGTIDPPQFDDLTATTGGKLAVGRYDYAVAALSPHGETSASQATATVARGQSAVRLTWPKVCHSTGYRVYRATAGGGAWRLIKEIAASPTEATDTGVRGSDGTIPATVKTYTDLGAAGVSAAPKTANTAALDPYAQNPKLIDGLKDAGVRSLAADASKAYPDPAGGAAHPAGESFIDGPARTVPRYPTNVYYNAGTREQQLDEYNWLYVQPSGGGGCADIPGVTTCRSTPVSWDDYLAAESAIMFRHVVGNDPRPHYFHQSNLAEWDPAKAEDDLSQGGILYPVVDALKARYDAAFNATMPLVQLTQSEIGAELARRERWAKALAAGSVTAYLLDGVVHVKTSATLDVPLTGTTVGTTYGGQKSGWRTVPANTEVLLQPSDPAAGATAPSVSGAAQVGGTLTANPGTWTGTGPIAYAYRWQRCDAKGAACQTVAGADGASLTLTSADKGSRLRVVVFASNAVSAVSQATSAPSAVVTDAAA